MADEKIREDEEPEVEGHLIAGDRAEVSDDRTADDDDDSDDVEAHLLTPDTVTDSAVSDG